MRDAAARKLLYLHDDVGTGDGDDRLPSNSAAAAVNTELILLGVLAVVLVILAASVS